jgi:hypothetical protein
LGRERSDPEETIDPRPVARHTGGPTREIDAAESYTALRLDLRTIFPIERPGRYRLHVLFAELKTPKDSPGEIATQFVVSSPTADRPRPR